MRKCALFLVLFLFFCSKLHAFPSSLFWTVAFTDVVKAGYVNVGTADYFTIFNRERKGQVFPPDIGVTLGVFEWCKWAGEVGFDYFGGTDAPWFFNAKVRLEERAWGYHSPSIAIGIFDVGTGGPTPIRRVSTAFNVLYGVLGKTLPDKSRVFIGAYIGQHLTPDHGGFMVGYLKGLFPLKDCEGDDFYKWSILADYASGKNLDGGGGIGLQYSFNSYISILFGPTWFNDAKFNGRWKFTFQAFFTVPVEPSFSIARRKEREKKRKEYEDKRKEEKKKKDEEDKKKEDDKKKETEKDQKKVPERKVEASVIKKPEPPQKVEVEATPRAAEPVAPESLPRNENVPESKGELRATSKPSTH